MEKESEHSDKLDVASRRDISSTESLEGFSWLLFFYPTLYTRLDLLAHAASIGMQLLICVSKFIQEVRLVVNSIPGNRGPMGWNKRTNQIAAASLGRVAESWTRSAVFNSRSFIHDAG